MRLEQLAVLVDEVVRVEALIVDADLLHFLLVKVVLDVLLAVEDLVANGAAGYLLEPLVDALPVVDVEAAEHAAPRLVGDGLEADHAVAHEVLAVLHSYQDLLYFSVGLLVKPILNLVISSRNALICNCSCVSGALIGGPLLV